MQRISPSLLKNIYDQVSEGIVITDLSGKIISVNKAFTHITGYLPVEVIGQTPRVLNSGRHDVEFYTKMWKSLEETGAWQGEIWNRRKNGNVYVEMLSITRVEAEQPVYVGIFIDIAELKEREEDLSRSANYDSLTQLPNRAFMNSLLPLVFNQADRSESKVALCFLDLDEFKPINDKYGHLTGDKFLVEIANRLKSSIRDSDVVVRLGGDEFVILLTGLGDVENSEPVLKRILWDICQPVIINEISMSVSASIGVAIYPDDGRDPDQLIRSADQMMYSAKQMGKNKFKMFDVENDRRTRDYHEKIKEVQLGIERSEFCMHYQPIVDLKSGKLTGVEALVRWNHPSEGLLPPCEFLPAIENTSLEIELGKETLELTVQQAEKWHLSGFPVKVHMNVSGNFLQDPRFVPFLTSVLDRHPGVTRSLLVCEILETVAISNVEYVSEVITACRNLDVTFCLDDFGTGYSSLIYLKKLPIKTIKIDSIFTASMVDDPDDISIVEGVINLADAFRKTMIVEGIETEEQGSLLIRMGCTEAQGFFISRPLPPSEIEAWSKSYKLPDHWKLERRWKRDDIPLLALKALHRRWVRNVLVYLRDTVTHDDGLRLGPRDCFFSQWYFGPGIERYGHLKEFDDMLKTHDVIHDYAIKAVDHKNSGIKLSIGNVTRELYALRDRFISKIDKLQQAVAESTYQKEQHEESAR